MEKIVLVLFVILLPSLALSQSPERLNILAVGQVMPGESPIPSWFDADPLVDYVLIPTDIDIMDGRSVAGQDVMEQAWRRFVRIYFPKTRDALLKDFDFFVFPTLTSIHSPVADVRHEVCRGEWPGSVPYNRRGSLLAKR